MATVEQRDAALAEFANKVKAEYFEEGATIDYDKLRRPGIFSRFLWMGEHAHRAYMYAQVAKESTYAGRRVTATEVDALTEHMDWAWRTRAMAQPLSLLLAGYMTWRSRKVWKFPFVTARPTFNPNVFPSERMPFLVGASAWATWHFVRFICYAPPSWFVTQWAVSEMAVGGYEKSKREDPRLRELMQQIKVARQAELAKRFAGARPGGQREGAQRQPSQPDMRYPRQQQQQSQQQTTYRDDASPTNSSGAGSETWGNAETYAENTSYSSSSASPSARPPATSYGQQPPPSSLPPTPSYSQPSRGGQASSEGSSGWAQSGSAFDNNSSDDEFDDMSPVSPAARRQEAASATRSGGSAWDRIRQQQGGQSQSQSQSSYQQQQQQQQQQQYPAETSSWGSSGSASAAGGGGGGWGAIRGRNNNNNNSASSGQSYTYSAADEERETRMYEKEKAQKEFDAMVERERNGQGASGGTSGASRDGKGWWN